MNDGVLESKVIRVNLANEDKLRQDSSKPVWMDEEWQQKNLEAYDGREQEEEKEA